MERKQLFILGAIFILAVLVFSTCFDPLTYDNTALTFNFGRNSNYRSIFDDDNFDDLVFSVFLYKEGEEEIKRDIPAGEVSVNILVSPGFWEIAVEAYLNGDTDRPYAIGAEGIDVIAGRRNFVEVTLTVMEYPIDLIDQEPLFITDGNITWPFDGDPFTLSTTGGSGTGAISFDVISGFDVISIDGNIVTMLRAGTAMITATKAGDDTYHPITSDPIMFIVTPLDPMNQEPLFITDGNITWPFDGDPFMLSTTGGSGTGAVSFAVTSGSDVISIAENMVTILSAGTATITATKAGDITYLSMTSDPITFTVTPAVIYNAQITVTEPVIGVTPNTTATIVTTSPNFTVSQVTWTPAAATFLGDTEYTAQVTLTRTSTNYTFTGGLLTAVINGKPATITDNNGDTVRLSATFTTSSRIITDISVVTQPTLVYTHGDTLDLSGLAVRITYNDDTTIDVQPADFDAYGMFTDPADGYVLERIWNNGYGVSIIRDGVVAASTNVLTVNKAPGAVVGIPTRNSVSGNDFTINAVAAPGNEQTIEYAISETNTAPATGWQTSTTFTNRTAGTAYYVFARSAESDNYLAGTPSVSQAIRYFIVTFDTNDATGAIPPVQMVFEGDSITLPAGTDLARTNFTFDGWSTTADGTGNNYDAGTAYTVSANTTLYAKWDMIPSATFNITFEQITDLSLSEITGPTISRTGSGGDITHTITLDNPTQYISIEWFINGTRVSTAGAYTLNAANTDFGIGDHFLTVEVFINSILYNKTVTFTVAP